MAEALSLIGGLYAHEKAIRKKKLTGPSKLAHRREHATPAVGAFFDWCQAQRQWLEPVAEQPVRAGVGLRGGARNGASGLSGRPRGEYRHQSSGAVLAGRSRPGGATGCSRGRNSAPGASA